MGTYKCKGSEAVAVMENAAESAAVAGGGKRKIVEPELSPSSIQLKTHRLAAVMPENSASPASSVNSTCESVSSGHALASCCSSNRSTEVEKESTKFADLEQENEVTTVEFLATSAGHLVDFRERREKTPSSGVEAEPGALESTVMPLESNSRGCSAAEKMPTKAELEEFFAAAERKMQKQFVDKYNYDIVKDEPLEGRYEWVQIQLKP